VKSVPTVTPEPGPCCTAIQRPIAAVMQKSVLDAAKPAGLSTYGAPAVVEIDASYFVASAASVMLLKPLSVVTAFGSSAEFGKLSAR